MNIFDVIGPVMIGPSSSHTAGAVRLSLLAISILGAWPVKAQIALHGSFAQTYRGHGTDMALLAGLMGWLPDDERIPQADSYAEKNGLEYSYHKIDLGNKAHPNTVLFKLTAENGARCDIVGSSVGGGQVQVTERQSSKMKKSQVAGILFGVAMGVLFSVSLGTVGFVLGASFANLGMVMFEGLDDPPDKK